MDALNESIDVMLILSYITSFSGARFSLMSTWGSASVTVYRNLAYNPPFLHAHWFLCPMNVSWNLYLPLINYNFHRRFILQGQFQSSAQVRRHTKGMTSVCFPTEMLLDFFNVLLQCSFSSHCCSTHINFWFEINVMACSKYSSCIYLTKDGTFFITKFHCHLEWTHLLK